MSFIFLGQGVMSPRPDLAMRAMTAADAPVCARMVSGSAIGERYGFSVADMTATLSSACAAGGEFFVAVSGNMGADSGKQPEGRSGMPDGQRVLREGHSVTPEGQPELPEGQPEPPGERIDGSIAGFAWIDRRGAFSSAPYLRLIAVAPETRGKGTGAALLAEFERRCASVGRDYCLLVSDFNERAISFYSRHGYERRGALPDFVRPGITEILMVKRHGEPVA